MAGENSRRQSNKVLSDQGLLIGLGGSTTAAEMKAKAVVQPSDATPECTQSPRRLAIFTPSILTQVNA